MHVLRPSYPKPVICHLAHQLDPGGTEKLVFEMARALTDEYEVIVCTLEGPGFYGKRLRRLGVPVYPLFRARGIDLNVVFALRKLWATHHVNLVHAHQYSPFFYAGLAKYLYPKAKLLFEEHGRHYPEVKKPLRILFNRIFLAPVANALVAVSEDVKERLKLYEGLPASKIQVIYNGIADITRVGPQEKKLIRREFGFEAGDVVAATLGRLDPIKNLPLFLEALALAKSSFPLLKGLIIGDGPEREKLLMKAKALGLERDCVFTGFREDGARLVQAADVFVLPSLSEGTSLALLEAMAAGLPVVATAVGGNPEIIEDGKSGLLVPSNHLPSLAAALLLLAEDGNLRQAMGQQARRRFLSRFTFDTMLDTYRAFYKKLLAGDEKELSTCAAS